MPRMDGTGPMGEGPKTGRGMGSCDGEAGPRFGIGRRMGRGFGFNCRRGFGRGLGLNRTSSMTRKELLEEQKGILKNRLEAIDKQLEDL